MQLVCTARIPQSTLCTSKYDRGFELMKYVDDLATMNVEIEVSGYISSNITIGLTGVEEEKFDKLLGLINNERVKMKQ